MAQIRETTLCTLPRDCFRYITEKLLLTQIAMLWKTGDKRLQQALSSEVVRVVHYIAAALPHELRWPSLLPKLESIKEFQIDSLMWYTPMKLETLPSTLEKLRIYLSDATAFLADFMDPSAEKTLAKLFPSLKHLFVEDMIGISPTIVPEACLPASLTYLFTPAQDPFISQALLDSLPHITYLRGACLVEGFGDDIVLPGTLVTLKLFSIDNDALFTAWKRLPNLTSLSASVLPMEDIKAKAPALEIDFPDSLISLSLSLHNRHAPNLQGKLPSALTALKLSQWSPWLPSYWESFEFSNCLKKLVLNSESLYQNQCPYAAPRKTLATPTFLKNLPGSLTHLQLYTDSMIYWTTEALQALPRGLQKLHLGFDIDITADLNLMPSSISELTTMNPTIGITLERLQKMPKGLTALQNDFYSLRADSTMLALKEVLAMPNLTTVENLVLQMVEKKSICELAAIKMTNYEDKDSVVYRIPMRWRKQCYIYDGNSDVMLDFASIAPQGPDSADDDRQKVYRVSTPSTPNDTLASFLDTPCYEASHEWGPSKDGLASLWIRSVGDTLSLSFVNPPPLYISSLTLLGFFMKPEILLSLSFCPVLNQLNLNSIMGPIRDEHISQLPHRLQFLTLQGQVTEITSAGIKALPDSIVRAKLPQCPLLDEEFEKLEDNERVNLFPPLLEFVAIPGTEDQPSPWAGFVKDRGVYMPRIDPNAI